MLLDEEIKSLVRRSINEALLEFDNDDFGENVKGDLTIDDIKQGEKLYHRPKDAIGSDPLAVIKSLMENGFSREYDGSNGGAGHNMYGPGVYNVYSLKSSNEKARGYGRFIVQSYLLGGYKDFLIFNKDMAKQVYGNDYWIGRQIERLMPSRLAKQVLNRFGSSLRMNDNSTCDVLRTSSIAVQITDFLGSRISQTKIRGIIYSGGHDGNCAFVRNFSDVIPYSYSEDNGRTWTVGITENLIWKAGHDTDVDALLKHAVTDNGKKKFDDVADRSINGFVLTYRGEKANYFEVATNRLISDVWFDYASNFNENGEAEVLYNGVQLALVKDGDKFVVVNPEMGPLCYLEDLPNQAAEMVCESRKLVDNFDTIENLLDINTPDDFHHVQIVKRRKDNPTDNKAIGNYHAGSWYPVKGWRIKSANDLETLKPQIIDACNKYNARAYITINNRSERQTNAQVVKVKAMYPPTDARHINADDIVPAQAKHGHNWRDTRKRFIIDIDTANQQVWDEVRNMLKMYNLTPLKEIVSPSGGLHIILPDKNAKGIEDLQHLFHKFDNWRDLGRNAMVHMNFDARELLYSNVDTNDY